MYLILLRSPSPIYTFFSKEHRLSSSKTVKEGVNTYSDLHQKETNEKKNEMYQSLVNAYYDLATVFYEWGWGSSFHFAYHYPGESFSESIRRHEWHLANHIGLTETYKKIGNSILPHILDVGCGIGGPMRNIARFMQCRVTGITLNPYQVQRSNELSSKAQDAFCRTNTHAVQGDFMKLPFKDGDFDGAYAIEATCHAPDRARCYAEVYRVLQPGSVFAVYEWCLTDKYDPTNPEHKRMKLEIEEGNGLPDIVNTKVCWEAMQKAGFEPVLERDLCDPTVIPDVRPWYTPLLPSWNPCSQRFQFNWLGAIITNITISTMEFLRIAPAGTVKTQKILQRGGFALRDAGMEGIFTVSYLMVGRKPMK